MPYKNKSERNSWARRWAEKHPEKSREIKRASQKRHQSKRTANMKLVNATPEGKKKRLAEYRFRFAVKKGWVIRPKGMHFHHVDYDQPYLGAWVTPKEHRRIHLGLMECPATRDYSCPVNAERASATIKRNRNGAIAANKKRWG